MGEGELRFWTDLECNSSFTDDWSHELGQALALGHLGFSFGREEQQHSPYRVGVRAKVLRVSAAHAVSTLRTLLSSFSQRRGSLRSHLV